MRDYIYSVSAYLTRTLVNKPAGVVVYAHRKGGHGIMTVRAALPFAVKPPKVGRYLV